MNSFTVLVKQNEFDAYVESSDKRDFLEKKLECVFLLWN